MLNRKAFFFLVFVFSLTICSAQTFLPSDFEEKNNLPKYGYGDLYDVATACPFTFSVENKNDSLVISLLENHKNAVFNLPDGKLEGIDNGEFGGYLKFIPSDTTKKEITISEGNFRFITASDKNIYVLEGLWHLDIHYGTIFRLDTSGGFHLEKLLELDHPPTACAIYNDSLFFVSTGQLILFYNNKERVLVPDGVSWSSIAVIKGKVYAGMQGGYAEIDLTKGETHYYWYNGMGVK